MTPARDGLLSTIRALLQMTEARGCTKAEAAIASAKAKQLMDKHGVRLKALTPFAGTPGARGPAEHRPEPFQRRSDYKHGSDVNVEEVFAGKGRSWTREPFRRIGRVLAGYVAVGFGIWAIAAFHITPSQQDHFHKYGQGTSNAEEPTIGDSVNPPYHKGQVNNWRDTLHGGRVEYFGSPYIRPVPDY